MVVKTCWYTNGDLSDGVSLSHLTLTLVQPASLLLGGRP